MEDGGGSAAEEWGLLMEISNVNYTDKLNSIFFGYFEDRYQTFLKSNNDFVHYTSLANLHNILQKKQIWLRNVSCMNDFMEVHQGIKLFREAFTRNDRVLLKRLLGVLQEINETDWEACINNILYVNSGYFLFHTYIVCLSEHDTSVDISEDDGSLAMWRAYGRSSGGAIVFDKHKLAAFDISPLCFSPVAYFRKKETYSELEKYISSFIDNIEREKEFLKTCPAWMVKNCLEQAIIYAIVSIKHSGFAEEKKWRLIYIEPDAFSPKLMTCCKENVGDTPQRVYKLNIEEVLKNAVSRVLIGATQYGFAARDVVVDDLRQILNIDRTEVEKLVHNTRIPLRP